MESLIGKLLQDFEQGKMTRRQLIQSLSLAAAAATAASAPPTAAADNAVVEAVKINHISYTVPDYAKTRDFYAGLLGMKVSKDDGKQCSLAIGETTFLPRSAKSSTQWEGNSQGPNASRVDHICYRIADWDTDNKVRDGLIAEVKRRGLEMRTSKTSTSIHFKDPDGYIVQVSGAGGD
jgi:catechol 2,3-dioxygenase-like lactoylglutathione lyase family enzyme